MRYLKFLNQRVVLKTVFVGALLTFLLYYRNESDLSVAPKTAPEYTKASYQESNIMEGNSSCGADEAADRRFLLRKESNIRGCQKTGVNRTMRGTKTHFYYNKEHKLLICAARKSGCSTVRRQMLRLAGRLDHIPHLSAKACRLIEARFVLGSTELEEALVAPSVIRAVVARHPLDRLVSGYKDKFRNGGQVTSGWKRAVMNYRHMKGLNTSDVSLTFLQYLQLIIHFKNGGGSIDDHFWPAFSSCRPCDVNYAYIFQTETLSEDFAYLSRRYQLPNIAQGLRVNNKTSSRPYEDYYKDIPGDVIRDIYSIYENDFLSYNFELPPSLRGFFEKEDLPLV